MYSDDKYTTGEQSSAELYTQAPAGVVQNAFINRVFGWMFGGLAVTGVLAWYMGTYQYQWIARHPGTMSVLIVAELAVVIGMSWGFQKISSFTATLCFLVYAALNGVTLSVIFMAYSPDVIAKTFFATSGAFGAMGLFGYLTKRDLSGIGSLCFMGLIGIIIASLINMFWYNRTADLVISYLGVLIFVGLTAWDMQKIKRLAISANEGAFDLRTAKKIAIFGALQLYLDFINLFLYLLRIFGGNRR